MIDLLLILLLGAASGQGYVEILTSIETSVFTSDAGVPETCGYIRPNSVYSYTQLIEFGRPISMIISANVSDLVNATTLTYAFVMRDMTTMPEVTLANMMDAVARGSDLASVTVAVTATGIVAAANFSHTTGTYPIGDNDGYDNPMLPDHMIGVDRVIYFSSSIDNQNATINVAGNTPLMVWW